MIKIGYAERQILDHLEKNEDARAIDLYKLTSNKVKPIKKLVEKKLIFRRKNGMYVSGERMQAVLIEEFMKEICFEYFNKHPEEREKILFEGFTPKVEEQFKEILPMLPLWMKHQIEKNKKL